MEETVTKRTTLCYCQNVYLITFATLCLLFFCAYFIFYSYIAICDPQIEYKSFQDVCAAKNTTRALKMQQPLGTTWVQTITIAVDCVYMFLLILYNFYCKADFTVLPQIADRTWEKKNNKNAYDIMQMSTNCIKLLYSRKRGFSIPENLWQRRLA